MDLTSLSLFSPDLNHAILNLLLLYSLPPPHHADPPLTWVAPAPSVWSTGCSLPPDLVRPPDDEENDSGPYPLLRATKTVVSPMPRLRRRRQRRQGLQAPCTVRLWAGVLFFLWAYFFSCCGCEPVVWVGARLSSFCEVVKSGPFPFIFYLKLYISDFFLWINEHFLTTFWILYNFDRM